jgi:hypothetical protein
MNFQQVQELVHDALKGGRCIALAEVHDFGLKEPFFCFEGGFPLVPFFDVDVVVSPSYVKLSEQGVALQLTCDAFDVWEWICITDCPGVDRSIVLHRAEGAILLFDHEGACGIGGVG